MQVGALLDLERALVRDRLSVALRARARERLYSRAGCCTRDWAGASHFAENEEVVALAQLLGDEFALVVQAEGHAERDRKALQRLEQRLLSKNTRAAPLSET